MPSEARSPRAQILIDGQATPLVELTVNTSRHARADTFSGATALQATGRDLGYWASVGPVECIVQGCNDEGEGYVTLLKGVLDTVEVRADAREGAKIHFSGRDNSAKLIDNKVTAKHLNKKSSDIVQELAQKYGLQAEVDDTGDDAGKVHTQDNAHLVDNDTAWNTIARLAEREGAFLYFKDDTIYFKLPGSDSSGGTYPIRFVPPSEDSIADGNIIAIQLTQNVHLNRGIKQTVRSWHTRKEKNIVATKEPQTGGSSGGISNPPLPPSRPSDLSASGSAAGISNPPLPPARPLEFIEHIPGLTDDQADKIATKRQIERQRHEMQIEVFMPGDVDFDPRMMVELSGTGSAWDQAYHCNTCTHQFSAFSGYTMRISAQNKKGGEGGGEDGGAGGSDAGVPETQGPNRPGDVPLPPSRPSDLGGAQTVPLPPTRPQGL
jgi:phage protein D